MLALRSYEQSNGFSVMDADELFFIVGGEGEGEKSGTEKKDDPIKIESEISAEGSLKFDEETGKATGSATGKISYKISGTKKAS